MARMTERSLHHYPDLLFDSWLPMHPLFKAHGLKRLLLVKKLRVLANRTKYDATYRSDDV
jgi:hypothetical protein